MTLKHFILTLFFICNFIFAAPYPDQHYVLKGDSLDNLVETNSGLKFSIDGKSIIMEDNVTNGYIILQPQHSQYPFNQGLPSWNGTAPGSGSSFKIQMRFPYGSGWSPWLTVGFWNSDIWSSYGSTSFAGGFVDFDYVKLNSYTSSWQFKIIMSRTSTAKNSPSLSKLSFFVNDSKTVDLIDYNQILNDKPASIFIPTDFIYQYGVDPQIGGSICSPTSVSMVLRSYNIQVDPYQFALSTFDPHFNIFGMWPRVVQNASEYGLDGAVTRYRSWSQARDVLAAGGRIVMSVSLPLYDGHLMMLAGFNSNGSPIVHDPAKSYGYSIVYNKSDISHSWFDKGGISYTFFPGNSIVPVKNPENENIRSEDFILEQNYPNPFNPSTIISFTIRKTTFVKLKVSDILGQEILTLVDEEKNAGTYHLNFNADELPAGLYLYSIEAGDFNKTKKMILLK
jgi:hypothetical protein